MNVTVYLFGEFNNGYTQYPDDYTNEIFQNFYKYAKATSQISIHREGNLMYYGYIRKLEFNRYIGFCVVINGLMFTKLDGLFSLFENTIFTLVTNGQLIHFNEHGNLITTVDRLFLNREEIDLITQTLRLGFHQLQNTVKPLPAVNYGISKDTFKSFTIENNLDEIITASHTYGYTYIYKSKGYNTSQLNSYKEVLVSLKNEKLELVNRCSKLEEENRRIVKQKKQYQNIGILFVVVFFCIIGLLSLNSNLNSTMSELYSANSTIKKQNSTLKDKNTEIKNINSENKILQNKFSITRDSLDTIQSIISKRQPLIIKSTSFDFNTRYLSFEYYGFIDQTIKIHARAFYDRGATLLVKAEIPIYKGDNTSQIFIDADFDIGEWYNFILYIEDVIIGGGRH